MSDNLISPKQSKGLSMQAIRKRAFELGNELRTVKIRKEDGSIVSAQFTKNDAMLLAIQEIALGLQYKPNDRLKAIEMHLKLLGFSFKDQTIIVDQDKFERSKENIIDEQFKNITTEQRDELLKSLEFVSTLMKYNDDDMIQGELTEGEDD